MTKSGSRWYLASEDLKHEVMGCPGRQLGQGCVLTQAGCQRLGKPVSRTREESREVGFRDKIVLEEEQS